MKVLIYSSKDFEIPYLEDANKGKHKLTFIKESLSSETAMKAVGFHAISVFSNDILSNTVLEKLKDFGVKYITLRSVGHDNVNLFTAQTLGIKVAHVPAFSPNAIAEHAVAILLALNRKLILSSQRVKQFNFDINNLIGFDLKNKTIGILGTGKIGSVMTRIMHGFGCKLLGFDIKENKELMDAYQLEYVSIKELCKAADVISIHLPLNTETHHLIDKTLFELMKPNVIIVNTARGAIINTKDMVEALVNEQISGLAIDVYEHERDLFFNDYSQEIPKDDMFIKLNALPNVLITGHHAFLTEEALTNIADATIYNLDCWNEDKATKNELHFKSLKPIL